MFRSLRWLVVWSGGAVGWLGGSSRLPAQAPSCCPAPLAPGAAISQTLELCSDVLALRARCGHESGLHRIPDLDFARQLALFAPWAAGRLRSTVDLAGVPASLDVRFPATRCDAMFDQYFVVPRVTEVLRAMGAAVAAGGSQEATLAVPDGIRDPLLPVWRVRVAAAPEQPELCLLLREAQEFAAWVAPRTAVWEASGSWPPAADWTDFRRAWVLAIAAPGLQAAAAAPWSVAEEEGVDVLTLPVHPGDRAVGLVLVAVPRRPRQLAVVLRPLAAPAGGAVVAERTLAVFAGH